MSRRPLAILGLCLLVGGVVGYFVIGSLLYDTAIGLNASAYPVGAAFQHFAEALVGTLSNTVSGLVWVAVIVLLLFGLSFAWMRHAVRAKQAAASGDLARRSFLAGTASGLAAALGATAMGAGAGLARMFGGVGNQGRGWDEPLQQIFGGNVTYTHPEPQASWEGSRVMAHRRLGRTGWEVSDIALGTGRISGEKGENIARQALDRGVNYFDTAPDYSGAGSEEAMGRAIRGVRGDLFIATKFCTPQGHLPVGTPVQGYIDAVNGSLSRLGTDYVDLVHIHSCDTVARLLDPNVQEAFDRLREQGKVRFLGFSSHTPRLVEVANAAIDSGRFDVMMLAYHFGIWPQIPAIIERARSQADMGVVAMKTLKGARHRGLEDFQPFADSYSQAALKWALSNPDVSCAVVSFFELQHVNEFLFASGQSFERRDASLLERYDREIAGTHCAPHCGVCLDSCPEGVPIDDVLRQRMYFEDYGWEKIAIEQYAKLGTNASACASCPAPCLTSCPLSIDIRERNAGAHNMLSLTG
jgi:predicted aldo/keto reductase-like oxidoreductase